MRSIKMTVGGTPIGKSVTWAYPNGQALGLFEIPTYKLTVNGTDAQRRTVTQDFEVFRFGVLCRDGRTASVVGLAKLQTYTIMAWLPNYRVHSARSMENGGWQVHGDFLIHDGPDGPNDEVFASIGCIEIMGPNGFVVFNDLLISLSGPSSASRDDQLVEIGRAKNMTITYQQAKYPPLKKKSR